MLLARAASSGEWHENASLELVWVRPRFEDVEGYYELLGITPQASEAEVRKAGKRLLMENHPDLGGTHEGFINALRAYQTLSNPSKRAEYDSLSDSPKATVTAVYSPFVPDAPKPGAPAWYKEPTLILDDAAVSRVMQWHQLVLEAARGFRRPLEIKVGACRCPAGFYVEDDIAVIGKDQVPQRWAALTFVLMKMCERKQRNGY